MTAAARAGIGTASVDLSHDGQMLLVDRFDVTADGSRLGFEDVEVFKRIASSLHDTLAAARADKRIPKGLIERMRPVWESGVAFASGCE